MATSINLIKIVSLTQLGFKLLKLCTGSVHSTYSATKRDGGVSGEEWSAYECGVGVDVGVSVGVMDVSMCECK